jgi:hypothetical protein
MKQNAAMERLQDGDTVQSSACPLCDTLRHAIMSETLATGPVWKCTRRSDLERRADRQGRSVRALTRT